MILWICTPRISAAITDRGIKSIVYHAKQPVSRNSIIFDGDPAFAIPSFMGDCLEMKRLSVHSVQATYSSGSRITYVANNASVEVNSGLYLQENAMTTDVYGSRKWITEQDGFTIENKISALEWVKKHGPFLIPLHLQKRIFESADGFADITFIDKELKIADRFEDFCLVDSQIRIQMLNQKEKFRLCFGEDSEYNPPAMAYPAWTLSDMAWMRSISAQIPHVVKALIQPESGMPRACAGGYYWVWGWDTIVAAMEMGSWGMLEEQYRIIDFMLANRAPGGTIPHRYDRDYQTINVKPGMTDALFILLVAQHCYDNQSIDISKWYPILRDVFENVCKYIDDDGFVFGVGTYPDNPRAIGRTEHSKVAVDTGAMYGAYIVMLDLAVQVNDKDTQLKCERFLDGFEDRYATAFFDAGTGMVSDCMNDGAKNGLYPVYALIPLLNRITMPLLLQKIDQIADYTQKLLVMPMGIRVAAEQSPFRNTECIHHSWFLFWDVCLIPMFRMAGRYHVITHYIKCIQSMWNEYSAIMEFIDMDDIAGHGAFWPIHGSAGVYRALLEGVLGIRVNMGSVSIVEGPTPAICDVENLHALGSIWSFKYLGSGDHVKYLTVNGTAVAASLVIPLKMVDSQANAVEIMRGEWKGNCRILDIFGLQLIDLAVEAHGINLFLRGARGAIMIESNVKPRCVYAAEDCGFRKNAYVISIKEGIDQWVKISI